MPSKKIMLFLNMTRRSKIVSLAVDRRATTTECWSFAVCSGSKNSMCYSCFEKGCPAKPYATMPKGIMGNRGLWYLIEALDVSAT